MDGFNRDFLAAYIWRSSDPDSYGKITVLQLPTDTQTQGPQQTQNSMISDTRVASERTLLERSNRIHYGNLLTLPIADGGVLYVEPLYTERISTAPNSLTFPQLSRVLVSYRENPAPPAESASATRPPWPRPSTRCSAPAPAAPRPPPAVTPPPRHHHQPHHQSGLPPRTHDSGRTETGTGRTARGSRPPRKSCRRPRNRGRIATLRHRPRKVTNNDETMGCIAVHTQCRRAARDRIRRNRAPGAGGQHRVGGRQRPHRTGPDRGLP